ncbi:MAG TPA: hypothetical protein VL614_08985 [Acetobacteraceae bacterium]|jgi:hypothetical protein|nr:hypothetical protein [Acetobacteraceae bacterium]
MLSWVESQDTPMIVVLVFAFCYLLAVVMFAIGALISRLAIAHHVNATTPAMLTPLGVIAGLVIAFLAARVWANVDHAHVYVAEEASEIRQAMLLTEVLPADVRAGVRSDIDRYLRFAETEDWPSMLQGHASLRKLPEGLPDALKTLLTFVPQQPGQQVAQDHAATAIERALNARRNRIVLSQAAISPAQWAVIFVLDSLILLTIAMLHVGRHVTTVVNLFVFSTAVAACVVLLMINDRPFTSGGITVLPTSLQEIHLP